MRALIVAAASVGCDDVDGAVSDASVELPDGASLRVRSGIVETGRVSIDEPNGASPHLGEVVVAGESIYVADSFEGITQFHLDANGRMTTVATQHAGPGVPRCTTIALHAPSSTLYCSAADFGDPLSGVTRAPIATYRVGPTGFTVTNMALSSVPGRVAGMVVHGDRLVLANFEGGLLSAPIRADGTLGPAEPMSGSGDAIAVASNGTLLAQLDRDRGLRLWTATPTGFAPRGEALALDGPPLAVTVRGSLVAVALGSQGIAIVEDTAEGLRLRARMRPPCSAFSAAVRDGAAVAGCMNGLYLYAWRDDVSHVRGYVPAATASLDVDFAGDALVASDWSSAAAYRLDLSGEAVCPLTPRGRYLRAGDGVTLTLANPGALDLHLSVRPTGPDGASVRDLVLPAGGRADVDVPASALAGVLSERHLMSLLSVTSREETAARAGVSGVICGPVNGAQVTLQQAGAGDTPPTIGQVFPPLQGDPGTGSVSVPQPNQPQVVVFNNPSCVAIWPELQDLAWLVRAGRLSRVVLVTDYDRDFRRNWRLTDLPIIERGDTYRLASNVFWVAMIPGAGHTEYMLDATGTVRAAERVYAGPTSPVGGYTSIAAN